VRVRAEPQRSPTVPPPGVPGRPALSACCSLLSLFLPDVVVTAGAADLAGAHRAAAVDASRGRAPVHWALGAAAVCRQSHIELAVRSDRTEQLIASLGGIPRLTLHDRERTGCPGLALAQLPAACHVVWLTFAAETNRYVPSNAVPAG